MDFITKIRKSLYLIRRNPDCVSGVSYYAECERKTKKEILRDQLFLLWRCGDVEPFYFTYGFDRKEMTRERMMNEYLLPYDTFQKKVNRLNLNNPYYKGLFSRLHGRTITGDKYYFSIFAGGVGIPTPKVYCYVKRGSVLFLDNHFGLDPMLSDREKVKALLTNDMDAFCKPADGQLGNGIFSLKIEGGRIFVSGQEYQLNDAVDLLFSADYLIQQRIIQHPALSAFNESSLNSIRLQTVMTRDGKVIPFGAGMRFGRKGSVVDNWAKGGVFVGIDMETGRLKERGFLKPKYGTTVVEHPDSHVKFKGVEIPFYFDAVKIAIRMHQNLYRCHSVGWDIVITPTGPVIIEGNGLWEISLVQAVHGGLKKQIGECFGM